MFAVGDRVEPTWGVAGTEEYDVGTVVAVRGDLVRVAWSVAGETYNEDAAILRLTKEVTTY